ncbi:ribosome biosynthesis protein [Saccharomycopsis crataegensis]|uniref:Ribosome biosynthesis protein n=1 Tax=Saccharomycopsis crataegensis TaxID=43959 RepID=A0AAV5QI44_9ASCO|nr:ribosome biosynthesis protein [Saccharomycopsis crataegensis]
MSETLEERLKKNSSAFDGLLSLIPSKYYYDDDTQEQWRQKKQTKEQLRKNKKLKLDPESQNDKSLTAADVLKKKAADAKPVQLPSVAMSGLMALKPLNDDNEDEEEDDDDQLIKSDDDDVTIIYDDEGNEIELGSPKEQEQHEAVKKNNGKKELSPEEKKKKEENMSKLKAKLQQKIETMKAKRKAPGSKAPGAPKSREQILEERRKKQEQRDLLKRKREDDEEEEEDEEDEDETMGQIDSDVDSDNEEAKASEENGVLFQNIIFNDGDRTTSDLTKLRKMKKKKGPANRDIKAHLKKVQIKKDKYARMDETSRKEAEEKDKWNRMLQKAEGVKVKDDEKMLKKALKNKERLKRKSENQWYERKNTVKKNVQDRLRIREENLQIRKENKGVKRNQQKKQIRKFQGPKAKKGKKKKAGF